MKEVNHCYVQENRQAKGMMLDWKRERTRSKTKEWNEGEEKRGEEGEREEHHIHYIKTRTLLRATTSPETLALGLH